MEVSIIIPTFNREGCLFRAISSVLAQEGVSFELIVVDDGSTDGTKVLIEKMVLENPAIRYFFQSNQGPSAARNLGIKKAQAPLIAFLDSDDEWRPGKLKAQLDFFRENPDVLICQTEEIWIRSGVRVNPMDKHKKSGGYIFEKCLRLSIVSPSCVMMRREFFDEVGFFDETFPACEDYDLWLRASARFPIGLIPTPFVIKYGGHADQRSHQFPVMDQFRIKSLLKLINTNHLTNVQKEAATSELIRRCKIVSLGAKKRGKIEEAEFYERLIKTVIAPTGAIPILWNKKSINGIARTANGWTGRSNLHQKNEIASPFGLAMTDRKTIQLLIYDLDGTLIDSRWDIANSVNWALKEMGFSELPLAQITSFVGSGVTHLMRSVLTVALNQKASRSDKVEDFLERSVQLYKSRYREHLLDETKLYPGVQRALEHFKNRKQAVITNKPEIFSRQILKGLGVDSYFFRLIGGDQEFAKKPSPEPVLEIMRSAQVEAGETIFIGDSAIDIETARNAGIKVIAVTHGFGGRAEIEKAAPDFILDDFSGLIKCHL